MITASALICGKGAYLAVIKIMSLGYIYQTADGYIALVMGSVTDLARIFASDRLAAYGDPTSWFRCRDDIKALIADCTRQNSTAHWLTLLRQQGYWAAEVNDWKTLCASGGFHALEMTQRVRLPAGREITLLRSPLRFNGVRPDIGRPAPRLGADTTRISEELDLKEVDV